MHYYHRSDVQGPVTRGSTVIELDRYPHPTPWDNERTLAHAETDDEATGQILRDVGFISDPRKVELTFDEEAAKKEYADGQDVDRASMTAIASDFLVKLAKDQMAAQQGTELTREEELALLRQRVAELETTEEPVKRGPGRPRKAVTA